jgi:hypothetical protein
MREKFATSDARRGTLGAMKRPPHPGKLGDIAANGHQLSIHCVAINGCRRRHTMVDLDALRARLGDDYPIADYVARLVCEKCGARYPDVRIQVTPITTGGFPKL